MFPTFDWQSVLQGLVPQLTPVLPQQPATFINPVAPPKTQMSVRPTATLGFTPPAPQVNVGTAAFGTSQGLFGTKPKQTQGATFAPQSTLPPPNSGTPKTQPGLKPAQAPKATQSTATQQPFLGETAREAQKPGTFGIPGFNLPTTGAGFEFDYAVDSNGYAAIVSPDGYVQPITATDTSGNEFQPIAYMSQQEAAFRAAELGVTLEEYQADLLSNGYTTTNDGGFGWAGGPGNVLPSGETSAPWWQGFESERAANKYYTEKNRYEKEMRNRQRDAARARIRSKSNQGGGSGEGGLTSATSILGTG